MIHEGGSGGKGEDDTFLIYSLLVVLNFLRVSFLLVLLPPPPRIMCSSRPPFPPPQPLCPSPLSLPPCNPLPTASDGEGGERNAARRGGGRGNKSLSPRWKGGRGGGSSAEGGGQEKMFEGRKGAERIAAEGRSARPEGEEKQKKHNARWRRE